jgi:hypothetical protein
MADFELVSNVGDHENLPRIVIDTGAPLTINADDQSIWELADNAKQAASILRPLTRLAPE